MAALSVRGLGLVASAHGQLHADVRKLVSLWTAKPWAQDMWPINDYVARFKASAWSANPMGQVGEHPRKDDNTAAWLQ